MIKFQNSTNQAKLKGIQEWLGYKPSVWSFSLPSGHTCPFALDCLSKADRITGKITDGKHTTFRCFQASLEAMYKTLRTMVWENFDTLRHMSSDEMVKALDHALPHKADIVRIHVGGDYFNQAYFNAWLELAKQRPNTTFYSYTKSIPYWIARMDEIPENFILNGSRGGRMDNLLDRYELKTAKVVYSLEEADTLGLEIDHDESHAIRNTGSFALLIHGTQPKGSDANKARQSLKAQGIKFEYSRK